MSPEDGTTSGVARSGDGEALEGAVVNPLPADPVAIEALIAQRRDHLASTVDELMFRVHPKEVVRRTALDAQRRVIAFATTPDGQLRTERLVAVAGAVAALVGMIMLVRSRRGRSR